MSGLVVNRSDSVRFLVFLIEQNRAVSLYLAKNKSYVRLEILVMVLKIFDQAEMSLVLRKPVFRVSDQVRHKLDCTATEDG